MQRLRLGDCVVARSAMKPGGLGACPHSKTTLFHAYPNHNYACSIMLCPIEVLVNWVGVQLWMFSCLLFSYRVAQLQLVESFTCWIVLLNCTCSIWSWSTDLKGSFWTNLPSAHCPTSTKDTTKTRVRSTRVARLLKIHISGIQWNIPVINLKVLKLLHWRDQNVPWNGTCNPCNKFAGE